MIPSLTRQPAETLRFLWPFVRPERRWLWRAAGVTLGLTAVEVAIPLLVRIYVDWITHDLPREFIEPPNFGPALIAGLLVGALLRGLFLSRQRALAGRIGERAAARLRSRLWAHLQELPLEHTESRGPGRLLVRFISDIRAVQRIVSSGLIRGSQDLLMVVVVLLVLALLNWRMALPVACLVPIYVGIFWALNPRIQEISRDARRRLTRLSAYLNERIVGMKLVKASVRQASEASEVRRLTRQLAERATRLAATAGALEGAATGAVTLSIALVLAIAAEEVGAGRASNGTIVAYVMLLWLLVPIFRRIASLNRSLQVAQISVDRLAATMAEAPESATEKTRTLRVAGGEILVKKVSFAYPDGRPVLEGVTLRAQRGELVALAGPNGAGKSTLLDLILRFQQPSEGRIVIDGRNIGNLSLDSLRSQIGWVPQDSMLFDGTIAENIAYGAPDGCSRRTIQRAARRAGVDRVAARFPDGLHARVGAGGQSLSHGERQRIALARALVADPPILLLDEITSGADPETEQAITQLLRKLARKKTIIVATHRLPALLLADRIYVLDQGRLVERGSHAKLMSRRRSFYARLFAQEAGLLAG
jgi:subfamily B ATP-binding cassette protein MsbA